MDFRVDIEISILFRFIGLGISIVEYLIKDSPQHSLRPLALFMLQMDVKCKTKTIMNVWRLFFLKNKHHIK